MSLQIAVNLMMCYNDSYGRIVKVAARENVSKQAFNYAINAMQAFRFMQTWRSACGGIYDITVPPSIFREETIVFAYPLKKTVCYVYFGGKFGYSAEGNKEFMDAIHGEVVPDTEKVKSMTKVYESNNS